MLILYYQLYAATPPERVRFMSRMFEMSTQIGANFATARPELSNNFWNSFSRNRGRVSLFLEQLRGMKNQAPNSWAMRQQFPEPDNNFCQSMQPTHDFTSSVSFDLGKMFGIQILKELKTMNNGKVWPYGKVVVEWPDGTISTQFPDRKLVHKYTNGKIVINLPDREKVTKYPHGTIVIEFLDGAVWTKHLDGIMVLELPDGKVRIKHPDGRLMFKHPNGMTIIEHSDGTAVLEWLDGKKFFLNTNSITFKIIYRIISRGW